MGKAQKFKVLRKIDKNLEAAEKKAKRKLIYKSVAGIIVVAIIVTVGFYGTGYAKKTFLNNKQTKKSEAKVERKSYTKEPDMKIDVNKKYIAKFTTNKGNFEAELFVKDAPKTVNNFVFLARENFYNGLTFHRVIKDFMIQGGDPKGDGSGGPGYKFADEFNSHKLVRGVLAMANSGANTNGSQFFIVTKDKTDWLDGKHTAFGQITSGIENVMNIEKIEVGENDKPKEAVIINSVIIEEK